MRILIVDDEKDIQRLFEQRFRRERRKGEVELEFALSGEEALSFLEDEDKGSPTLILSDINMPNMSGLEFLKRVREKYSELTVYMITAYEDEKNRERALNLGANDYLTKPLDFNLLKEKLSD